MIKLKSLVSPLHEIAKDQLPLVGGKALNLGRLFKIPDIRVPEGFCVTTTAFQEALASDSVIPSLLDQLASLDLDQKEVLTRLAREIRNAILLLEVPASVTEAVSHHLSDLGNKQPYAVRSSATAEDLPHLSFAGQHDSYLNVIGQEAILEHIRRCWASLFTDRAVIYRMQNGFDHRQVSLAVIVQKMIRSDASGIMFTADPTTGSRKVTSIDASFGLGEALVSGLVAADCYKVREGTITERTIGTKKLAVRAQQSGGTEVHEVDQALQDNQTLTDEQILHLADLGRQVEAEFGSPQDIEWCLAGDEFYIVQSRPITTLFPIPEVEDDQLHVYVSVGHQQMMTDAMKPLGLSVWLLTTPAPMKTAGNRLFVDITPNLTTASGREGLLNTLGKSDPLIKDALLNVMKRAEFSEAANGKPGPSRPGLPKSEYDPDIVTRLIKQSEDSIAGLEQAIKTTSGTALFDFIQEDINQLRAMMFHPESMGVIISAQHAAAWLNEKMEQWLGERNAADILAQSVPNNVTAEMGLALLDVADVIRPYPEVVDFLSHVKNDDFLEHLPKLKGGKEARDAIQSFLHKYGMRCAGEIDITKPRWCERPTTLVPLILSNVRNFNPGASQRKFEEGRKAALAKMEELRRRLRQLPAGEDKAEETERMINILRNYSGYREYPKYAMVKRYYIYKQALLREAAGLVRAGVIKKVEDIFYLTFAELRNTVSTMDVDYQLIHDREVDFKHNERLTPPRVMTSEGEIITGHYEQDHLPAGAIAGLAVSAGTVEGRARVILDMEEADLKEGDILVTSFTDPSWTPLFLSVKGIVTEVGGLMTHGAVIAREYGLPAVVGVENATRLIKDGQRIRVNGTEGYVEIIEG